MRCVDGLHICVDCGGFIAYGDIPDDPAVLSAIEQGIKREADAGGQWVLTDDSQDREFSWTACDCCGSKLGGFRFGAAVLYPE